MGPIGPIGPIANPLLFLKVFSYFSSKRMPPVPSDTGTGGSGAW
jgi:hypothetical protein